MATALLSSSSVIRDPISDHLITPQNSALLVIDYQPAQVGAVRSMDRDLLVKNIVSTVKLARLFGLPVVHSTVNVKSGRGKPTVSPLGELLKDDPPVDRTSTNAWEDADFVRAVRATGRRKLILCALWTEICMAFPALDALREGYDVYPVVDAIGGTSLEAHRAGLERVMQAGAQPIGAAAARGSRVRPSHGVPRSDRAHPRPPRLAPRLPRSPELRRSNTCSRMPAARSHSSPRALRSSMR